MKKQKIKKIFRKKILYLIIPFFMIGSAFGAFTSYIISPQISTDVGSYGGVVSFTGTTGQEGVYVNNADNSAIIGNYFKGYYFDSLYGYFRLDWSNNKDDNVRIKSSTDLCPTGYGYKLGGKAYSELSGYIDFDYNSTNFVYYCLDDGKLHGTAYGKYVGFQKFEGILVGVVQNVVDLIEKVSEDAVFQNDTTDIEKSTIITSGEIEALGGDLIQIDTRRESIFYIIK